MKYAVQISESVEQTKVTKTNTTVRLNKYLSESGFCSRREADRLIERGDVFVDGVQATMGMQVTDDQVIKVGAKQVKRTNDVVYLVLNKPIGITCTTDTAIKGNLTTFMNLKQRIFPIGRLDKDSSGLILMTSDGDVVNQILRSENHHEKEYIVTVNRPYDQTFLNQMANGVEIFNMVTNKKQTTKPCTIIPITSDTFKLILTEGMNRQIRRMTQVLGYRVIDLKRVRVMNILLGDLPLGHWRYLTQAELTELKLKIT